MPAPLLTRDVHLLRTLRRPRWLRLALTCAIFFAAAAVMGLHVGGEPACTDAAPCAADEALSLVIGVFLAAAVAGFVHAGVAAGLASGYLVANVGYDLMHPGPHSPAWLYLVDLGFTGLCFAVARIGRVGRLCGTATTWLAGVVHERAPKPAVQPRLGRGWRVVAIGCVPIAVGIAGWGWFAQARADAQQEAAVRVTVEVVARVDEYTIRVRLPEGELADLDVLDARDHPVGQRMGMMVDGRGLRQPVSEPYDGTAWLALAVIVAGVGWACGVRGAERAARLHALFDEAQPVTWVYVRAGSGWIAVYPADARPGEPAVAEFRCLVAQEPVDPVGDNQIDPVGDNQIDPVGDDQVDSVSRFLSPTQPALLYGVPAPDRWCTVVVDGAPVVPTGPLRTAVTAPAFTGPTAHGSPEPLAEPAGVDPLAAADLPLRAEEVEALGLADRDANPYQVKSHLQHPVIGYALIAAMPLVLVTAAAFLPAWPYRVTVVVSAAAMALSCVVGWRLFLRSRLAWNGGGVAVVGVVGARRLSWPAVLRIEHDQHDVMIYTADGGLVVGARTRIGQWAGADRGAPQLAIALRYARDRATATGSLHTVDPPRLAVPVPAGTLYALWFVGTAVLAWILQTVGAH